jgi:hypothetical protein
MKLNIGDKYCCFKTVRDGDGGFGCRKDCGNVEIRSGTVILVETSTETPEEFYYPHLFRVPWDVGADHFVGFHDDEVKEFLVKIDEEITV